LGLWFLIGAAIFVVSDRIVESKFGEGDDVAPLGIVVGSVVDEVPESIIFGSQIALGQVISASFLAAVWVSNIPQALAPSAALAERAGAGRSSRACTDSFMPDAVQKGGIRPAFGLLSDLGSPWPPRPEPAPMTNRPGKLAHCFLARLGQNVGT
jgi:hypothetical protein